MVSGVFLALLCLRVGQSVTRIPYVAKHWAPALLSCAVGLSGFLLWHSLESGSISPHKWAGFSALGLAGLAVLMLHMGVIGDMLPRHRVYLEELLSRQRSETRRPRE